VAAMSRPLTRPISAGTSTSGPTTAASSRLFPAQHPGLFRATGFADHPYMRWYSPNREQQPDPQYSSLGEIGVLELGLDRAQLAYGSHKRFPIYDTEFGYITTPPKHDNQIVALYETRANADAAKAKLVAAGVDSSSVQVMDREVDRMAGGVDYEAGNQGGIEAVCDFIDQFADPEMYALTQATWPEIWKSCRLRTQPP